MESGWRRCRRRAYVILLLLIQKRKKKKNHFLLSFSGCYVVEVNIPYVKGRPPDPGNAAVSSSFYSISPHENVVASSTAAESSVQLLP